MEHRNVLPAGTILDGKYRIDRLIGAGGFGMTYAALDLGLDMAVAVKEYYPATFGMREGTLTVRPRTTNDAELFNRLKESFLREARTLAQLRHPCIVRVLSVFEGHGTAYMIMEFESGKSLKGWVDGLGRKPTQAELDKLVMPLLDALELLHEASFLHRDIAPDNIIVRADGSPVLLDFGAARRVMAELSGALTGIVKSGYSPQEQYANDPRAQGPWSDIYALGATLYRCVTGETPAEATLRMLDDPMTPASEAGAGQYRAGFLAAIDQAMRVRPKERPQTIPEMRTLLKSASRTTRVATAVATEMAKPAAAAASGSAAAERTGSGGWSKIEAAAPALSMASRGIWKIAAVIAGVVLLGGMSWAGLDYRAKQADALRIEAERVARETLAKGKDAGDVQRRALEDAERIRREAVEKNREEDEKRRQLGLRQADAERAKREEAERLKRLEAEKQARAAGGSGDKLAVAIDNAFGPCPFCDDVKKLVSADEYAELTGLPFALERTIKDALVRKGPQEDSAARAILEQLAKIALEPDPYAVIKTGQSKCTTYYFGFLDNGAQRVGTHQCMVRSVQIGGELVSLTIEKTTGDGFHANFKKFRVNAPAYLGRTYLKGHAVTRYNLAVPRNKENGNFGNKVGLLVSLGGKPALISTNQNGFTKADDTFFEVIVLEP